MPSSSPLYMWLSWSTNRMELGREEGGLILILHPNFFEQKRKFIVKPGETDV